MKKLIFTAFCVSAFFIGIGAAVQRINTLIFKSDEKAVIVLKRSPIDVDSETKIKTVQIMSVDGKIVHFVSLADPEKISKDNLKIHFLLPDKLRRMDELKLESADKTMTIDEFNPADIDGNFKIREIKIRASRPL